jgi:hypothetical protein
MDRLPVVGWFTWSAAVHKFRVKTEAELRIWNECSRLMASAIIYYDTLLLSRVYEQKLAADDQEAIKILRGTSPVAWRDVNLIGNFFTNYYSWSPGMVSQTPGKGANYMVANFDSNGVPLSGSKNYRVTLAPKVPAANFWSVTLYDAENSSGLDNGQPFPSLGSRDKPQVNADGTIDLYISRLPAYPPCRTTPLIPPGLTRPS